MRGLAASQSKGDRQNFPTVPSHAHHCKRGPSVSTDEPQLAQRLRAYMDYAAVRLPVAHGTVVMSSKINCLRILAIFLGGKCRPLAFRYIQVCPAVLHADDVETWGVFVASGALFVPIFFNTGDDTGGASDQH